MKPPDLRRSRAWRAGFVVGGLALLVAAALVLGSASAAARPGGGSSYHGSSSSHGYSGGSGGYSGGSSSGSGGSGNGLAFFELLLLCIEHPVLGLILLVVFGGMFALRAVQAQRGDWSTSSYSAPRDEAPAPPTITPRRQLEELRRFDDAFSVIIFEDFLSALYAQVHSARGRGALPTFSAFLTPQALTALGGTGLVEVKTIIVGALQFTAVSSSTEQAPTFSVTCEFEANYTEVSAGGQEHAWYARERWVLSRRASAPSRTPDRSRVFACPSCGAPLDGVIAARCRYCGKDVCNGEFDWIVRDVQLVERTPRGPMLTEQAVEEGTDDPTVIDDQAQVAYAALTQRDPALTWEAFQQRVGLVFNEFQRAWSARDLATMRPFLSDNLFEVEMYWVRAYQAQNLRNVTENARITRFDLARVTSDRFFDAITVRLFATSLDYTVSAAPGDRDGGGRLVCGSRSRERKYSEYWTFLRSTRRTGPARDGNACPSCGAPLAINMSGYCTYCKAKVTSGDFDWVLSRIEQDEAYSG